jgi:hypothetical protein
MNCNKNIVALIHTTHINNLDSIIKQNGLYTKIKLHQLQQDYTRGDQCSIGEDCSVTSNEYPGIFMSIVLNKEIGSSWPPEYIGNISVIDDDYITLVFSPILLKQKNYHANLYDNMGFITENTYSHHNIDDFINKINVMQENMAEIVFHDNITLNTLLQVWTTSVNSQHKVNRILSNNNLNIKVLNIKTIPNISLSDDKYCKLDNSELPKYIDVETEPNFCYWTHRFNNNDPIPDITKYKEQIAENCGVTEKDVDENSICNLSNQVMNNTSRQTKHFPNYNWTINWDNDELKDSSPEFNRSPVFSPVFNSSPEFNRSPELKDNSPVFNRSPELKDNSPVFNRSPELKDNSPVFNSSPVFSPEMDTRIHNLYVRSLKVHNDIKNLYKHYHS